MAESYNTHPLLEVAGLFLKLGTISFGGPAAHISLMEQEVVTRRGWLSREHFMDLLAATNLVPGPNATEMAIHIGYVHAGWAGLVAGGVAFILPAFLITFLLSIVYVKLGTLPQVQYLFYGIYPAVLAIILSATYRLGKTAIKDSKAFVLALVCLAAVFLGVDEVLVLLAAGGVGIVLYGGRLNPGPVRSIGMWAPWIYFIPMAAWLDDQLVRLFTFFFKVGALLFGSGMVLFAFIERDIVTQYGWLSRTQLLDAIAVGQITPGPVLSTATFIGYLVAGWPGAVLSTVAVFLPSFFITALIGPWIPHLRRSRRAQAFLRGVNTAVVALILVIVVTLVRSAIVDLWTALALVAGLAALLRWKVDSIWIVAGGAVFGLLHALYIGLR